MKIMKLSELLLKDSMKFTLFGGKGGVGKTTCASASAIWAADHGRETLIISTDPAHSLSDSFNLDLSGGEVIPVPGFENLYGLEINPKLEFKKYRELAPDNPLIGSIGGKNIEKLVEFHKEQGTIGTVTGVFPPSRFGDMKINGTIVTAFKEKAKIIRVKK